MIGLVSRVLPYAIIVLAMWWMYQQLQEDRIVISNLKRQVEVGKVEARGAVAKTKFNMVTIEKKKVIESKVKKDDSKMVDVDSLRIYY